MFGDGDDDYLYEALNGKHPDEDWIKRKDIRDLGHGMKIMFIYRRGSEIPTGFFEAHKQPGGRGCAGSVLFDVPENEGEPGPRWTLHSLDPLHIEPSVLCGRCDWHGFIRNGVWEPC